MSTPIDNRHGGCIKEIYRIIKTRNRDKQGQYKYKQKDNKDNFRDIFENKLNEHSK